MATVTSSVGTDSRDYPTLVLFHADLSGAAGGIGNDAVAMYFNDSVGDEEIAFNNSDPDSIKVTVPVSERHNGTAGTGARIVRVAAVVTAFVMNFTTGKPCTLEWFEIDGGDKATILIQDTGATDLILQGVIAHNTDGTIGGTQIALNNGNSRMQNCFFYHLDENQNIVNSQSVHCVAGASAYNTVIFSCTNSGTKTQDNFANGDDASSEYKNVISMDAEGVDFTVSAPASATANNNMSSDATAPGGASLTSKVAANQFDNVGVGTENLHLKSGADAIDAGADLGTTPAGVQFDIDNGDRDTAGVTWDMGADEFGLPAPTAGGLASRPVSLRLGLGL